MRLKIHGHWRDVVGFGEKSGVYILLDAKTGEFIWNTLIGPGGDQGGIEWGTAFDGDRIYASITRDLVRPTGHSVNAGPAVVDGSVYWGSGHARSVEGNGNNKFYAFSIDGQ